MQSSVVAPTPIPLPEGLCILAGSGDALRRRMMTPYSDEVRAFLHALSRALLTDSHVKEHADVTAFAFWCRKGNIDAMAEKFAAAHPMPQRGAGLVLHIAPANVPINFAYSWAFGLLAGNSNIVRAPSRNFIQTGIVCAAINRLLQTGEYPHISSATLVVTYPHDDTINRALSELADGRVLWGGDESVNYFRSLPAKARTVDISFADRYSLCAMNAARVKGAGEDELTKLVSDFYNDAYQMDQNACSSPHLILWTGTRDDAVAAQGRFWPGLRRLAGKKYDLSPFLANDKLVRLYSDMIRRSSITNMEKSGNILYVADVNTLPDDISVLRGIAGYFYQTRILRLAEISPFITERCQTLSYFGFDADELHEWIEQYEMPGPDRVVPVGAALDISPFWDGYDVIGSLSRTIGILSERPAPRGNCAKE